MKWFPLFWTGLVLLSCNEVSVTAMCSDDVILVITDELLTAEINGQDTVYTLGGDSTQICNPETFEDIPFTAFEVMLQRASYFSCDACVRVREWTGPGCDLQLEVSDTQLPLLETQWRLDRIVEGSNTYFAPCLGVSGQFLPDQRARFSSGNFINSNYQLIDNDQRLIMDEESSTSLAIIPGYSGEIEGLLLSRLFTTDTFDISLQFNQLIIERPEISFTFYGE